MMYKFKAYGHENITAKHKTTLEFTKDKDLSLKGDCIIGVKANFSLKDIKFIKNNKKKIRIIIKATNKNKSIKEEINAEINPGFDSDREMVIRKSNFKDKRTFAVKADKGAFELKRKLIENIAVNERRMKISIYC